MPEAEIITIHGWGFDSSCWQEWKKKFGETASFRSMERGYFCEPGQTPLLTSQKVSRILITHSFGLHLCPEKFFRQVDLLIIFSGFIHFHPVAAQYKRRSMLIVNQMMNKLQGNPENVLKDFYENAFDPQQCRHLPEGEPKKDLLLKDLQVLNTHEIAIGLLKRVDKMCILHGSQDTIVPRRKGRELYACFSDRAKYFEIKKAGHALPFTHTDQCWHLIEPEIKELIAR